MAQNNAVSITIGAALKSSFGTALGGGRKQLMQMGQALKSLDASGKRIQSFQKLKTDVIAAKNAWQAAETQVRELALAMKQTANPTAKMKSEFEKAKNVAGRAKAAYEKKQESLRQIRLEMKAAGQSTRNLAAQQTKLGASVDRLKSKYNALDQALKRGDGIKARRAALRGQILDMVALGAAMCAPLKAAIDFESEMADVRKVVDFKDQAGESMAKLSNIFDIPITEMGQLGDALNHLSDNTAAKASEIVQVITRAGAQARDFGLSAEQTAALGDTFVALGKKPEVAATAMNALLLKLNTADKQSAKFQSGLSALGIEAQGLKDAIRDDAQGALLSFLQTVSQVEKQERAGILSDLFGLEYADDISLLAGQVQTYQKTLDLLGDSKKHNSMQREFANRSNTTKNSLQLLSNQITEIGMNIGTTLLPPLNFLVNNVLRPMSGMVADLAERFLLLTSVIFGATFALIGIKIAAIGLGYAWTFVLGGVGALVVGFRGLQSALALASLRMGAFNISAAITAVRLKALAFGGMIKAFAASLIGLASRAIPVVIGGMRALTVAIMTNPIGLIVVGIALAAGLLITNWDKVKTFFSGIWDSVKPVWEAFADWIGGFWKIISAPIRAIGKVWDAIFGSKEPSVEATITNNDERSALQRSVQDAARGGIRQSTEHTHNNAFNITVQAAPGQDVGKIADEVMRRIKEQTRGALFVILQEPYYEHHDGIRKLSVFAQYQRISAI